MIKLHNRRTVIHNPAYTRGHARKTRQIEDKSRFKELFNSLSGENSLDLCVLQRREYVMFALLSQLPFSMLISYLDLMLVYTGMLSFFIYIFWCIVVGMPLFMLFIFMGYYSRCGYFRFWNCLPLLKGIACTTAIILAMYEPINISSAAMSTLYMGDLYKRKLPWIDCSFDRASPNCIPMNPKTVYTEECCNVLTEKDCTDEKYNKVPLASCQDYYVHNKINSLLFPKNVSMLRTIKPDWAIAAWILWILIFIFVLIGFARSRRILFAMQITAFALAVPIFCLSILSVNAVAETESQDADNETSGIVEHFMFSKITDYSLWMNLFMHSIERSEPGSIVWLSNLGTSSLMPTATAVTVFALKIFIFLCFGMWLPLLTKDLMVQYKIRHVTCITIRGLGIIFAVVPNTLSRLPFPQLWCAMWFFAIFLYAFSSTILSLTCTIDSFIDAYPSVRGYRVHLTLIMCLFLAGTTTILVSHMYLSLIRTMMDYGLNVIRSILVTLIAFGIAYVYSVNRLVNDYKFLYAINLAPYWSTAWKVTPFIVVFSTVYMINAHLSVSIMTFSSSKLLTYLSYTIAAFYFLPVIIIMLWIYVKNVKAQTLPSIIKATSDWGPPDIKKRQARLRFNPQREMRYKINKLHCEHRCLRGTARVKNIVTFLTQKKNLWLTPMKNSGFESAEN